MQLPSALLALLALGAAPPGAAARRTVAAAARRSAAGSPVEKVVNLLKDLKGRIEQDGENEQQAYDKYACFCDKAMKAKADAIDGAKLQLRKSGQEILRLRGHVATRAAEISELAQALQKNADMQADSTAIRQKENAAYAAETAETKEALEALERAILVLKGATSTALLQSSASSQAALVASAAARVLEVLPTKAALAPEQLSLLTSAAQARQGYAPQSLTVQGILGNMYDTFSSQLESSTETEAGQNRDFETLIALKVKEAQEMESMKADKEDDKAKAEEALAEETSLYDDTEGQMKADIAYFDVTKAGCEAKFYAWGNRSSLRSQELQGVKAALAVLSSDSARELFGKAIKPGKEVGADASYDAGLNLTSFLQIQGGEDAGAPVAHAYALLKAQATGAHSLRLAQLAASVREAKVGHFEKVIKEIDAMITTLQDEDTADIEKRDQCKSEYQKIASTVGDLEWKIENNQAMIDKLENLIQEKEDEKAKTIADIQAVSDQMAAMTSQRAAENQDFLNAAKDDRDAIALLDQAKAALSKFYTKNQIEMGPVQGSVKGLALEQLKREPEFKVSKFEAPDATFSDKGSRKLESKDISSILTMLIQDLTDEIRNGMKDEEAAQLQYEAAMKSAQQLKEDLQAKEVTLQKTIARLTEEKGEENSRMTSNKADLKDEVDYKAKISPDCDWILGAFKGRAERRAAEVAGLKGAKDYLAGASQAALLQRGSRGAEAVDDAALGRVRFLGLAA